MIHDISVNKMYCSNVMHYVYIIIILCVRMHYRLALQKFKGKNVTVIETPKNTQIIYLSKLLC